MGGWAAHRGDATQLVLMHIQLLQLPEIADLSGETTGGMRRARKSASVDSQEYSGTP